MNEYVNKEWQQRKVQEQSLSTSKTADETHDRKDHVWSDNRIVLLFQRGVSLSGIYVYAKRIDDMSRPVN